MREWGIGSLIVGAPWLCAAALSAQTMLVNFDQGLNISALMRGVRERARAVTTPAPASMSSFPIPAGGITRAQLNADGTRLLYIRQDKAHVLDVNTGADQMIGPANAVKLARDGRTALLQHAGVYETYGVDTGRRRGLGFAASAALSGDGSTALLDDGSFFRTENLLTGDIRIVGQGVAAAISGDGRFVLIGDARTLQVIEVRTGLPRHLGGGAPVALSNDGRVALVNDGRIYQTVDVSNGRTMNLMPGSGAQLSADGGIALIEGGNGGSSSACAAMTAFCRPLGRGGRAQLSADGRTVAVSERQAVTAYDTKTGQGRHWAWGELLSLSANGRRAAVLNNGWIEIHDR